MTPDTDRPVEFTHWFAHRLGVALRFQDVFTNEVVRVPLEVSVPGEGWRAVLGKGDSIYRFAFTEAEVPSGTFEVDVEAPGGEYVNHQAIQIVLPLGSSGPPVRGDYLSDIPLWPTRRLRLGGEETALVGRLATSSPTSVEGLDVRLVAEGQTPPAMPFARTDAHGEFLYRLPWYRWAMDGMTITPPANLDIHVTGSGGPIGPVSPSNFTLEPGRVQSRTFGIP